jgi:hypothetical protein
MDNVLRTAVLVPLSGLLPLGLVILSSILRPLPALVRIRESGFPVAGGGR